jgi:hypothetical protein
MSTHGSLLHRDFLDRWRLTRVGASDRARELARVVGRLRLARWPAHRGFTPRCSSPACSGREAVPPITPLLPPLTPVADRRPVAADPGLGVIRSTVTGLGCMRIKMIGGSRRWITTLCYCAHLPGVGFLIAASPRVQVRRSAHVRPSKAIETSKRPCADQGGRW